MADVNKLLSLYIDHFLTIFSNFCMRVQLIFGRSVLGLQLGKFDQMTTVQSYDP